MLKIYLAPCFFIGAFWCIPGGSSPLLYPMWYVRDLMVMVVMSPVLYWIIKKLRYWFLFILLALMFSVIQMYPGFSFSSALFFSMGVYWAVLFHDKMPPVKNLFPFLLLRLPMAYADTIMQKEVRHNLFVLFGVLFLVPYRDGGLEASFLGLW